MTWEILLKMDIYFDLYSVGSFLSFPVSKKKKNLTLEKKKEIKQRELFSFIMDVKQDVIFNWKLKTMKQKAGTTQGGESYHTAREK